MSNKTFYQVVKFIEDICDSHPQIANFYYGNKVQIDADKVNNYPMVICNPAPSTSGNGIITFTLELVILDLSNIDFSDELEIQSKTFDIAQDILGEIKLGFKTAEAKDYTFVIPQDVTINPIQPTPDFNDRAIGCSIDLEVEVTYLKNGCQDNIINQPFGIGQMAIGTTFIIT